MATATIKSACAASERKMRKMRERIKNLTYTAQEARADYLWAKETFALDNSSIYKKQLDRAKRVYEKAREKKNAARDEYEAFRALNTCSNPF
jgi:hypothetical protein